MLPDKILYKVSLEKNLEITKTRHKFPAGRLPRLDKKDFCGGKFVLEGGGFGIMETRNLAANFYGLSLFLARLFFFSKRYNHWDPGKCISRFLQIVSSDRSSIRYGGLQYFPLFEILSISSANLCICYDCQ